MKDLLINLQRVLIILMFCLSFVQFRTGSVTGKVIDDEGNPLPGMTVTIEGPNMVGLKTAITSESGSYRFLRIPVGTYLIRAEISGFKTHVREEILVRLERTIEVDFTMSMTRRDRDRPAIREDPPPVLIIKPPEIAHSELNRVIAEEIEQLSLGRILFNPPTEMEEHVKERIEVRITQNINEDFKEGLKGRGVPQIEEIRVSAVMTAKLSGEDFTIDSLSDTEQAVFDSEYTQWEFDVTPTKAGQKILQLSISASFDIDEFGEKKKSLPVMEREIFVKVNPGERIKRVDWYKILGAIGGLLGIIATIIGISKHLKKKKSENLAGGR